MDFFAFERAALRLKEQAGVATDKDLSALLGMDVSAYNKRKTRGSFPIEKLHALATTRPDLKIDVAYVLTGITSAATALLEAKQARIEQAVNTGLGFDEIRQMETQRDPASIEVIVALLRECRASELAAVHSLLTSIVSLREALQEAQKPQ
jgi:hypothetical protein